MDIHLEMKKIRLIDGCFPGNPSSIAGDNIWRGPTHFEWCMPTWKDWQECASLNTFWTNWTLKEMVGFPSVQIAWLLEPPSLHDWPYLYVAKHRDAFKAILTYDKRLLDSGDTRFKFAPHGGSWIDWDLWGMCAKTKDVCMIVSDKKDSEGHKLRHKIAKEFSGEIDIYGPSFQTFDRKWDVLRHYRYCVVVESVKMDFYFSEKLIDPISVATIPIYWGCPSINEWFDGIIPLLGIEKLKSILDTVNDIDYEYRKGDAILNIRKAKQYRMPEDWMFEHYPELFR